MKITTIKCQHAQLPFGMIVGGPVQFQRRVEISPSRSLRRYAPTAITAPRAEHVVLHLAPISPLPASGTFYVLKGKFESDFVALQSGRYPQYTPDGPTDHTELVRVGIPDTSYMVMGNPYFSGEIEVHNMFGEDAVPFSIDVSVDDSTSSAQVGVVLTPTIVLVDPSRLREGVVELGSDIPQGLPELVATAALLRTQYPTTIIPSTVRALIDESEYQLKLNALGYRISVEPSGDDARIGVFDSEPPVVLRESSADASPQLYLPFGEKGCLKYYYGVVVDDIEDGVLTPSVLTPQLELPEDFPVDGHLAYYRTTGSESTTGFQFEVARWGNTLGHLLQPIMVLFNHVSSIPIRVAVLGQTISVL